MAGLQQADKQLCAHLLDAARMVVAQYFAFSVCDHLQYCFAIRKQQSAVNAAKADCAAAQCVQARTQLPVEQCRGHQEYLKRARICVAAAVPACRGYKLSGMSELCAELRCHVRTAVYEQQ